MSNIKFLITNDRYGLPFIKMESDSDEMPNVKFLTEAIGNWDWGIGNY